MDFEEELKRRMALARSQGWNDEEINRSALIQRAVNKQREAQAAAAKPQPGQREGWDAVGSTILNFLPGGSLLDKALHKEEITAGDVGTEVALSLVPFGLGKIARGAGGVVKAGKAASQASRIGKVTGIEKKTVQAAQQAPARAPVPAAPAAAATKNELPQQAAKLFQPKEEDFLQRTGGGIRAYGRGVITGVRPEGSPERLLPSQAKKLNKLLDDIGAKGSVPQQLSHVENIQQQTRNVTNQIVTANNKAVTPQQLKSITDRVKTNILGANGKGIPGFDPKVHGKLANQLSRQMASAKDTIGLENFRKSLDDVVNYSRNPQSPDPMTERIAQAFRREIDSEVTSIVPAAKRSKGLYAGLEAAKDALVVNSPMSLQQTAGTGGLFSKLFSSGLTQKAFSGTGRLIQGTGRNMSRPIVSGPVNQAAVRMGADALGMRGPAPTDGSVLPEDLQTMFPDPQSDDERILNELAASGASDFGSLSQGLADYQNFGSIQGGEQQDASGAPGLDYNSSDLFNAGMKALEAGDSKGASQLFDAADMAAKFEKSGAPGKLSADQQKTVMGTNTADQLLNQIEKEVGELPAGLVAGGVNSLFGKLKPEGGPAAKAEAYNQSRGSKALMLIKAIQGSAGQISDIDREMIMNAMPLDTDSKDIRKQKIQSLRNIVSAYRTSALSAPAANDSFASGDPSQLFSNQQYAY